MEIPKEIKDKARGRQQFKHGDQVIYEWEQNLDEVLMYLKPPEWALPKNQRALRERLPPGETLPELYVNIERDHIEIGVRPNPPFLNEELGGPVVKSESYWMVDNDELVITLQKMRKAETWTCACKRHGELDSFTKTEVQKQLMLERFQQENPGFDFSNAEFNGMVPDARTFMGGVSYTR